MNYCNYDDCEKNALPGYTVCETHLKKIRKSSYSPSNPDTSKADIKPKFGDVIENGYASVENPHCTGIFVRTGHRTGRMNPGKYYELTDGKGNFWQLRAASDKLKIVDSYFIPRKEADRRVVEARIETLRRLPKVHHRCGVRERIDRHLKLSEQELNQLKQQPNTATLQTESEEK